MGHPVLLNADNQNLKLFYTETAPSSSGNDLIFPLNLLISLTQPLKFKIQTYIIVCRINTFLIKFLTFIHFLLYMIT